MVRYPNVLFWIFSFTSFISFYITRVAAGSSLARGKAAKGRFVSVYIFIFGFTKVQSTERIFKIYNFKENRNIARNVARNVATV